MDTRLLELLVCPLCKGPLHMHREAGVAQLRCNADRLGFPIRDGIAIMLESEAIPFDPHAQPMPVTLPQS